jgi:hypothetical protein
MNRNQALYLFLVILLLVIFTSVCSSELNELASTIESQNTQIAKLSTQAAKQDETNWSQWETISYLSTQMPFALGVITPIPAGITITPTAYLDIEYPPNTRTGVPEIDRVIDAISRQDVDARVELIRYIQFPCTTRDGLGGPPKCEEGEADGTIVTAFPVLYSVGTHTRPEDIWRVLNFTVRGLFAVYQVLEVGYEQDYWPVGDDAIVFTSEDGGYPHTVTLHVTNGEIVRLDYGMSWPPFDQIWERSDTFILPPSTRLEPYP